MKFVSIKGYDISGPDVRIDLIGDDQKRYSLDFQPSTMAQLSLVLRQVASLLRPDQTPIRNESLYTMVACQPIAVEEQRQGILITTAEKFEIPLVLTPETCIALRACIDQIERGIRHDGPIH